VPAGAEAVREAYRALRERRLADLERLSTRDFELDLSERVLNPAVYRGDEGLLRFLGEIDELWTSMDIAVERMLERGDEVLAILNVTLTGRGSGVGLDSRVGQWWTLRDGKLARMRLRTDPDAALAEFEAGASH
jgi:ketosteroid isomerase-like protein